MATVARWHWLRALRPFPILAVFAVGELGSTTCNVPRQTGAVWRRREGTKTRQALSLHDDASSCSGVTNGTFVVSQSIHISEVDTGVQVLRELTSLPAEPFGYIHHIVVDSRGNVIVADSVNCCVLVLDPHLSSRRVIIDQHQLNNEQTGRLCYEEQSGQLLVVSTNSMDVTAGWCYSTSEKRVAIYDVLRRLTKSPTELPIAFRRIWAVVLL